ncbi:MAG: hypothetical protein NT069_13560 [Planctomycetota bacterium]|nr:hypothetical protein [Planctomycetota bacterium]
MMGENTLFGWLEEEMARIKTNKFHLVDGPLCAEQRKLLERAELPIPPSYKQFALQFGNAKLYRQGNVYLVQVFATPGIAESDDGEAMLHFGRTDMTLAYLKVPLLSPGKESPVFQWSHGRGLHQAASGFEEWLNSKCKAARRLFKRKQWQQIENGPARFSDREWSIVEARRHFRWRVTGIDPNGDLQFEVYNGSDMVLPFLSIGVRRISGQTIGGVWLPVSLVMPGQTHVIVKDCYKDLVSPSQVVVFDEPDPAPEDRERYWEFKAIK